MFTVTGVGITCSSGRTFNLTLPRQGFGLGRGLGWAEDFIPAIIAQRRPIFLA